MMPPHFFVGLDLGQQTDPTAIAVLERTAIQTGFDRVNWVPVEQDVYHLRHLERLPLKTPYAAVVEHVREILQPLAPRATLVVDATGIGGPIVEMLKAARLPGTLIPVIITSGDRETRHPRAEEEPDRRPPDHVRAGRAEDRREPRGNQTLRPGTLHHASQNHPSARETFSPAKSTAHDDLVLAAALAAWKAKQKPQPLFQNRRLL